MASQGVVLARLPFGTVPAGFMKRATMSVRDTDFSDHYALGANTPYKEMHPAGTTVGTRRQR